MSSKLQQTAREIVQSGKLGAINLIRASYDRNSDSGAWLYPIPPDADAKTVNWEMFLGPRPKRPFSLERFFRWRCYWDYSGGIATDLFVHLMTTIHYVMGATVPETVVATGANYRHQKTHEVPDTLNASAVYGKENFMVSLGGTFNNAGGGESGFAILGNEGSLVFRGGRMTFTPEHGREGNDWIVESWPSHLEKAYWADPAVQKLEKPDTWPSQMESQGESWSEVGPDATVLHMSPLRRVDAHAQAGGRGRPRRPPRGRGRAHGERVDQAQGARVLGLREGRPEEGVRLRRRGCLTAALAAAAPGSPAWRRLAPRPPTAAFAPRRVRPLALRATARRRTRAAARIERQGTAAPTLVHEHVLVDFGGAATASRSRYDADEAFRVALPHLEELRGAAAGRSSSARRPTSAAIRCCCAGSSEASGLQIVTNTGYYGAARDIAIPKHAYTETPSSSPRAGRPSSGAASRAPASVRAS